MRLAIMLFARDLRVHDNPALDAAVRRAESAVPLFVLAARSKGAGTFPGGESAATKRLDAWLRSGGVDGYADGRNDMAGDETSRLSPCLHFGCLSPLQLDEAAGPGEFARQLARVDTRRRSSRSSRASGSGPPRRRAR